MLKAVERYSPKKKSRRGTYSLGGTQAQKRAPEVEAIHRQKKQKTSKIFYFFHVFLR